MFKRLHLAIAGVEAINHVLGFQPQKMLVVTHQVMDTFILFCVCDILPNVSVF